jgi:hypothetical protein
MPNTNLENSKINMKTRIRNRVQAGQSPKDLGRLAKSARFVGLLDDAEVETDIDTQMSAAIPTASIDELVDMSEGIAELRGGSADMGQVATTDNLTEGGNKFLKAENVQSEISVSGDLSYDNGVVSYTAPTAAALQVVATVGDLPLDATAGTQAVVTANNNLYIRTADGWYAVALINTAPTVSGNDASYTLATDGTPTVITLTATDPENDPVTFSHSVTSGALNGTTVTQNDNVFTVTPHASNPATFELTFSADDSVNVATSSTSSFTLVFVVPKIALGAAAAESVYIYDLDGTNEISITPSDSPSSAEFGKDVKIADDKIVVSAWKENGYTGSVYVYDLDGTNEIKITASDGGPNTYFGYIVAVGHGKIVVGAQGDLGYAGSVYVYDLDGSNEFKITASDGAAYDEFGRSVAVGNNKIVVGAYGSSTAYIYDLDGTNEVKITASDAPAGQFGNIVAIGDNKVAVGVRSGGINGVYVYDLDGTNEVKITASDGASGDYFGSWSVAVGGSKIVVGAHEDDDNGTESGSVYVYDLDGTNEFKITASDGGAGDRFGYSVAVGDNKIVVGTYLSSTTYIYDLDGSNEVKIPRSGPAVAIG